MTVQRICAQCAPKLQRFLDAFTRKAAERASVATWTYECRQCSARCCQHYVRSYDAGLQVVCIGCADTQPAVRVPSSLNEER